MNVTNETCPDGTGKTERLPDAEENGHRYAVLKVGPEDSGREVLFFLKNRLGLSAGRIGTVKFDPLGMLLNGVRVNVRARAVSGDVLMIRTDDPVKKQKLIPYPAALSILYEDALVLAVDKPAGMVCHPSPGHAWDSLSNIVRAYYDRTTPELLVHIAGRLDRDTSGVVVFSKNSMVSAALQKAQYAGTYIKEYLAAVHGTLPEKSGVIREPVDKYRDPRSGLLLLKKGGESASRAETAYEVLYESGAWSLLRVTIMTGRMHQIRFHMSDFGHPLLGDPLYGDPALDEVLSEEYRIGRAALHAHRITFAHPSDGQPVDIISPVPPDMQCYLPEQGVL